MIKSDDLKFNGIKVGVLYGIFILFTVMVRFFNRDYYADSQFYKIGFSNVNKGFQSSLTSNETLSNMSGFFEKMTDILAYAAIAVMVIFVALGVYQLFKSRSFGKVDYSLYCLAITYILVFAVYAVFEFLIINYRPVKIDDIYEASYPSSHTMLAIVVYATAINQISRTFKYKKNIRKLLKGICAVCIALAVVGRLLTGIHWFTDIIGAILISTALVETYNTLVMIGDYRHQTIKLKFAEDDVIIDEISEPAEIDNLN